MESRRSEAGLSLNKMLDAELPTPQMMNPQYASINVKPILEAPISQEAFPRRAVRVKPLIDTPVAEPNPDPFRDPRPQQPMLAQPVISQPILPQHLLTQPSQLSQYSAPTIRFNPTMTSNIIHPSMRVQPVLEANAPIARSETEYSAYLSGLSALPPSHPNHPNARSETEYSAYLSGLSALPSQPQSQPTHIPQLHSPQMQSPQLPPGPPKKPFKSRAPLDTPELLKSLKTWSTSIGASTTPVSPQETSKSTQASGSNPETHTSSPACLMTSKQISQEMKSLQALLDSGFIQPLEYENRRFQLQSISKFALQEQNIPNVDANGIMSPMESVSSITSGNHVKTTVNKNIRVFVSSTFRDMSDERDTLVKYVFPQLQRECKKRGLYLTSVDLRWGITSEQTDSGNTVNICLSEIDRSQYFLAILGGRYGWAQPLSVPPVDLNSASIAPGQDALLKKSMVRALPSYPWIRAYPSVSVTELEIRHAVLNKSNENLAQRSLFLFKSNASDEDPRLTSLKSEIQETNGISRRNYLSPDQRDFGDTVLNNLIELISKDYPNETNRTFTPVEMERVPHIAFEESRSRFFIPRETDFQAIDSHIASMTSKPMVIIADQGMGKSAFLSNWASRYRLANPERLVITHYIGCTSNSTNLVSMLQRLIGELYEYSQQKSSEEKSSEALEMPTDLAGLTDKFIELLTAAGSKYGGGAILILDALNQLTSGRTLEWLPNVLPPGVQVIASTVSGTPELDVLSQKMSAKIFHLQPLSATERESFTKGFMNQYAKTLKDSQIAVLSKSNACANPLYLKTLLEELRVFGSFEELDQKIKYYLSAKDAVELFILVFKRIDSDAAQLSPSGIIGSIMNSIYCSRSGLSEQEIIAMFKLTPPVWSSISLAVEDLLVDSSGYFTFFHDCVRSAVASHYLQGKEPITRRYLAEYFMSCDASDPTVRRRRYQEAPYQFELLQDWSRLFDEISKLEGFEVLETPEFRFDLYRYWRALPPTLSASLPDVFVQKIQSAPESKREDLLEKVAVFMKDVGQYPAAEKTLKLCLSLSKVKSHELGTLADKELAKKITGRMEKLGYIQRLAGNYADASKIYRLALTAKRAIFNNQDSQDLASSINSLAILCRKQGNYEEASKLYHEALDMRQRLFGTVHVDIAQSYNSLGCLLQDQGKYDEASKMLLEAIRQRELLLGKSHPDVAMSLMNLGNVYLDWSKFQEAEPVFQRSLAIYESTFGPEHPSVALVLNSMGGLYQEMGRFDLALPMYIRNLETKIKLLGSMHPDLALAFNDIAVLCSRKDNNELAEDFFNGALKIRRAILGEDHPDYAQSLQNLGSIYQQNGWYKEALPLFKQSLAINTKAFGTKHPNVASACTSIAGLLQLQGPSTYNEAVTYYKKALDIYTANCADTKPDSDLALTCNDLAVLYVKQGNWKEAEAMYLDALKHYTGCFGPDHSDVAQALKNLGAFYISPAVYDKDKAVKYLRQSVQVFTRTLGFAHSRTQAVNDLLNLLL